MALARIQNAYHAAKKHLKGTEVAEDCKGWIEEIDREAFRLAVIHNASKLVRIEINIKTGQDYGAQAIFTYIVDDELRKLSSAPEFSILRVPYSDEPFMTSERAKNVDKGETSQKFFEKLCNAKKNPCMEEVRVRLLYKKKPKAEIATTAANTKPEEWSKKDYAVKGLKTALQLGVASYTGYIHSDLTSGVGSIAKKVLRGTKQGIVNAATYVVDKHGMKTAQDIIEAQLTNGTYVLLAGDLDLNWTDSPFYQVLREELLKVGRQEGVNADVKEKEMIAIYEKTKELGCPSADRIRQTIAQQIRYIRNNSADPTKITQYFKGIETLEPSKTVASVAPKLELTPSEGNKQVVKSQVADIKSKERPDQKNAGEVTTKYRGWWSGKPKEQPDQVNEIEATLKPRGYLDMATGGWFGKRKKERPDQEELTTVKPVKSKSWWPVWGSGNPVTEKPDQEASSVVVKATPTAE